MEIVQDYSFKLLKYWRTSLLVRVLSLIAAFALTALLIVLPARSQPVVLSFLMNAPEVPTLRPLIAEFERNNPNIRLNMIEAPNATNLVEDLNTSSFLLGSSPYDLVNMDVVWLAKFAAAGWLRPLDDQVSQAELATFLPGDIEASRYQGKLYRLPWRTDVGMLYYRTDLLQQAGLQPPETFANLLQAAKTVQQANDAVQWGYVWQGRQYEGTAAMFTEVLQGYGGFWVNPETNEVGLDRPEAINALNFLLSTIQQGISPAGVSTYQEEEARRLFQSGNTVFMRNWPYAWELLNQAESPVRGNVSIKPMVHAPNQTSAGCLGGWGWGIASTTQHPEEAWKAIQFFTSAYVQKQTSLTGGYLPSLRSLYNDPDLLKKYEYFPLVLEVLQTPALRPQIAQYAQASDILQRYLSAAISGRTSSEEALQAAARETRSLLGA
ncbi:ABC transporter substrate-binding protein [Myxacorys almedinensis]|uniref:Extracellular solute-binding protein n=1 Tax=Myxacorys almedinensis A TaxID=2690445 RepID=A0A8J7YYX6_9CYAN|nr:ABC transporter substrate-binding protein [Myxacorys almedinensis]NDJ15925.1 extracellular solute-binding protein [Myxacorys almedinensis A]